MLEEENLYLSFNKDYNRSYQKCLHRFNCKKLLFLKLGNYLWKLYCKEKS